MKKDIYSRYELMLTMLGKELGTLVYFPNENKEEELYSFVYSEEWLKSGFALSPDMPLTDDHIITRTLMRPFLDCAPDAWGRKVLCSAENFGSTLTMKTPMSLNDFDFFYRSDNVTRCGALAIYRQNEIAKVDFSLNNVQVVNDLEKEWKIEQVFAVLKNGIASGGARPKVNVIKDGQMWLAKPVSIEDSFITSPLWEAVNLKLAELCGLTVAETEYDASQKVLYSKRFDRKKKNKFHFASARTLLGMERDSVLSYAELAKKQVLQSRRKSSCLAGSS